MEPLPKEIKRIFRAKEKRRRKLAKLPFDKKILILIELQKIASGIHSKKGKTKAEVWSI